MKFPARILLAALPVMNSLAGAAGGDTLSGSVQGIILTSRKDESAETERRNAMLHHYAVDAVEMGILMDPKAWKPYRSSETTVVYLQSEPPSGKAFAVPARHPVLDQKGLRFHPQVLPILAGTTVDFPNGDPLFHNVFSYSECKEFDLGRYPTGDSRSVTFDMPGVVRVYCEIHSEMNATILVLDNPFFATPNDEGAFVIHNVPEGKYLLNVWHGRDIVLRRWVAVKPGETTTVNLSF